jgi:hypothetical protein
MPVDRGLLMVLLLQLSTLLLLVELQVDLLLLLLELLLESRELLVELLLKLIVDLQLLLASLWAPIHLEANLLAAFSQNYLLHLATS